MSFGEFVLWLGSSAALSVVSSLLLTVIRKFFPQIVEKWAIVASVLLAALASVAAMLLQPYLGALPAWVEQFWPFVVWIVQQLWYELRGRALG